MIRTAKASASVWAISKAIIEMDGGAIGAHSKRLGKGATFVIDLPLDRAELSV